MHRKPTSEMPAVPPMSKNHSSRHDMSVILVTGSYDHEIRFWEAWSGICSRTIARSGESGVSHFLRSSRSHLDVHTASKPSRNLSRVRQRVSRYPFGALIRSLTASV